jgi:fatty-acid peroxygenase
MAFPVSVDTVTAHRGPGEWVTIEQIKTITRLLAREMRYTVPDQDLGTGLGRLPALPNSRFVMRDVELVAMPW